MNEHHDWSPAEREQLEQELLELHFGCHEDPAAFEARIAAEPALRELQREVLAQAEVLEAAVRPEQPRLALPQTRRTTNRWRWLASPGQRLKWAAAAALLLVFGTFAYERVAAWRYDAFCRDHVHLTVSAPKAVPSGATWSFTVQTKDLNGSDTDCRVRWNAFGENSQLLDSGEAATHNGTATVAMGASITVPKRIEVVALGAGDQARQLLELSQAHAGPLVHLSTDRPVYRPGEKVYVRAVVLDRTTQLPIDAPMGGVAGGVAAAVAELRDAKGSPVATDSEQAMPGGVASFVLQVPDGSAGGEHTVRVRGNGTFGDEEASIVVRAFREPQLQKQIVLDRKSYAPGARGSAKVTAKRLGDNAAAAAGGRARGALLVDGTEVWHEEQNLDARGAATFRFAIPSEVEHGAARFVATITDGGIVETEVEPFVVPTGVVRVTAFPEGGTLVAGVENGLYLECTDTLGRPIDSAGELIDDRGERIALFRTEHQGRARLGFLPDARRSYRIRLSGQSQTTELPAVQEQGIALRLIGDEVAAGAPLRVGIGGRGNGPWLLGVFSRGVLVGQTTLRSDDESIDAVTEVTLPANAAGVLRVTVFGSNLQPLAERLVRRRAAQFLDVAVTTANESLSPGDQQEVRVRTTDEAGQPVRAVIGASVSDAAIASLGLEPRIGLADRAALFGDVFLGASGIGAQKLEDFGDFFLGVEHSASNVDLLLGTRGWRRFVWRNDDAAKAALLARGDEDFGRRVLAREGFSQTPQVKSNLEAANAPAIALRGAARAAREWLVGTAVLSALAVLLWVLVEGLAALLRRTVQTSPLLAASSLVGVAVLLMVVSPRLFGHTMGMPDSAVAADFRGEGTWQAVAELRDELTIEEKQSAFDSMLWNTSLGLAGGGGGEPIGLSSSNPAKVAGIQTRLPSAPGTSGLFDDIRLVRRFEAPDNEESAPSYFVSFDDLEVGVLDLSGFGQGSFDPLGYFRYHILQRQYAHTYAPSEDRRDFTPTICWQTLLVTDERGEAKTTFATTDAVTTWRVDVDAHLAIGTVGRVGQGSTTFATTLPLQVEAKLPDAVAAGDRLLVPVAAIVKSKDIRSVSLRVQLGKGLVLDAGAPTEIALTVDDTGVGRGRALLPITVDTTMGPTDLLITARAGRFVDRVRRGLRIEPRGFPHSRSAGGRIAAGEPATWQVAVPSDSVPDSGSVQLKVYPSPIAALTEGLEGMLREPTGCFEQASSSNYPNTMVLNLIEATGDDVPAIAARARELLPRGYAKITGYECTKRGYEWFGHDPGHEALTAYGLLQFGDMAKVYDVDLGMVDRTRQWLLKRRDGRGNYPHDGQDHHSFGGRSATVTNAYVTYALLQAGTPADELRVEIDALAQRVAIDDPYELALIACALHLAERPEAARAREHLAELQAGNGSLPGAKSTITMSGGSDAIVEATGFAVLAWLHDAAHVDNVMRAVEYLREARSGHGTFGATQATIVALRALTGYAIENRRQRRDGTLRVLEGDRLLVESAFSAGDSEALTFELWSQLEPGVHTLRLEVAYGEELIDLDDAPLPWSGAVTYHADQPADDPDTATSIAATLRSGTVREGETVALDLVVTNTTDRELPTPMAIIGLPAGLEVPTEVLDDLQKADRFAFWELRGRELVLYWRKLDPAQRCELTIDLVARVPGTQQGPASRTYLYYTPEQKRWSAPLEITVTE